jgi:hypothetical protein
MNIENQPGMRLGRSATEEFLRGSKGPRLKPARAQQPLYGASEARVILHNSDVVPGGASIARPANWIRPAIRGGRVNYYRYGDVAALAERLCQELPPRRVAQQPNLGLTNADKEHNDEWIAAVLSPIIHQRIRWRTANQLSQAQAAGDRGRLGTSKALAWHRRVSSRGLQTFERSNQSFCLAFRMVSCASRSISSGLRRLQSLASNFLGCFSGIRALSIPHEINGCMHCLLLGLIVKPGYNFQSGILRVSSEGELLLFRYRDIRPVTV